MNEYICVVRIVSFPSSFGIHYGIFPCLPVQNLYIVLLNIHWNNLFGEKTLVKSTTNTPSMFSQRTLLLLAETKSVHEQCGIENRTGERDINKHIISRSKQCTDTTLYLVILKTNHGVKNVISTGSGTLKLHMSTIWEP